MPGAGRPRKEPRTHHSVYLNAASLAFLQREMQAHNERISDSINRILGGFAKK